MARIVTVAFALLLGFAAVALADDVQAPECVRVTKEAPYRGYGYDHLVTVHNGCTETVTCDVATNVDPAPQHLTLRRGESRTLLVRRGSPASAFEAIVRCEGPNDGNDDETRRRRGGE